MAKKQKQARHYSGKKFLAEKMDVFPLSKFILKVSDYMASGNAARVSDGVQQGSVLGSISFCFIHHVLTLCYLSDNHLIPTPKRFIEKWEVSPKLARFNKVNLFSQCQIMWPVKMQPDTIMEFSRVLCLDRHFLFYTSHPYIIFTLHYQT